MGYTGTIVVGRSARLLVHEDGIGDFGYQHRYVRPLGERWQLVETGGRLELPGLREPCRRLAKSTGWPVLAAHVFDSDWAQLCAAVGDSAGPVVRLPALSGQAAEDVIDGLLAWSAAAGLRAHPAAVRTAVTGDQLADDAVFAVVNALGVKSIGRTLPRAFPVESWPFSSVSALAYLARQRPAEEQSEVAPAAWQKAAVRLDAELWAAAYRPAVDVAPLARQAIDVLAARCLARGKTDEIQDDLTLLEALLAKRHLNTEPAVANDSRRQWADRRATDSSELHGRAS